MNSRIRSNSLLFGSIVTVIGLVFLVPVTKAFLDELASLQREIEVYQLSHAGDFSDFTEKLEDIAGPQFLDVREDDWFSKYVNAVASWGIVSGYKKEDGTPAGLFGPANPVTVAEALKMVSKAAKIDESLCLRPTVHKQAQSHWAKMFVSCAEERGMRIFQGVDPDLNRPVSRAEVLAMLHDAFGDRVLPLYSTFKDTSGNRYEADIAFAVARDVVTGDRDSAGNSLGTFRPDDNINRAELSKIIYTRLKVKVKEEASV